MLLPHSRTFSNLASCGLSLYYFPQTYHLELSSDYVDPLTLNCPELAPLWMCTSSRTCEKEPPWCCGGVWGVLSLQSGASSFDFCYGSLLVKSLWFFEEGQGIIGRPSPAAVPPPLESPLAVPGSRRVLFSVRSPKNPPGGEFRSSGRFNRSDFTLNHLLFQGLWPL